MSSFSWYWKKSDTVEALDVMFGILMGHFWWSLRNEQVTVDNRLWRLGANQVLVEDKVASNAMPGFGLAQVLACLGWRYSSRRAETLFSGFWVVAVFSWGRSWL